MLPTGQKHNRKRKKRKGEREREKSKGKTLKKIQRKKIKKWENNLVNLQSSIYKILIEGRIKWRKEELREEKNLITLFFS